MGSWTQGVGGGRADRLVEPRIGSWENYISCLPLFLNSIWVTITFDVVLRMEERRGEGRCLKMYQV